MKTRGASLDGERPTKRRRLDDGTSNIIKDDELKGLQALPPEIIKLIFEKLADKAGLQSLDRTCRLFHSIIDKYYLWPYLRFPKKDYSQFNFSVDKVFNDARIRWLYNGDVVVLDSDGYFYLLPGTMDEWRYFSGHFDPYNEYTPLRIKDVILLQHNKLATCAEDGICIWDRLTGELLEHLPPRHDKDKPCVLLNTHNNSLVSASPGGSIYLYSDDRTIVQQLEYEEGYQPTHLYDLHAFENRIIAEFSDAIVSWNKFGRDPKTCLKYQDVCDQIYNQLQKIYNDEQLMSSGLISSLDSINYSNPNNAGLCLNWGFHYPGNRIELLVNNTFSFLVDVLNDSPPIFIGVRYKNSISCSNNKYYFLLRNLGITDNLTENYEALFDWSEQEKKFKSRVTLELELFSKATFMQSTGKAMFVMYNSSIVCWDVRENTHQELMLEMPRVSAEELEMYAFGSDDWTFHMLISDGIVGVHNNGEMIIWDVGTGKIKNRIHPPCFVDSSQPQYISQVANQDILVRRHDQAHLDEETGDIIPSQEHVSIYRFFNQSAPNPDAMEIDSDILGPQI